MVSRDPVLTKAQFYLRWQRGEFGNRLRSWNSPAEIPSDVSCVSVRIRQASSPLCRYKVPVSDLPQAEGYVFGESAPDDRLTIQGEVCYSHRGWYLYYSLEPTQMRTALANSGKVAHGIVARELIKHYCNPSSFSDLEALLELYPSHVIEFSCYSMCLGDVPHRNTVIWEVRKY